MKKLKTIVVEDERLPRLSLLKKLEDFRDLIEVTDSCDSYETARQSILTGRPDLLLLDIQLAGRDAISLLEELKQTIPLPYVIFTTAYSDRKYLMSAIKLSAVDYLIKPVGMAELSHAIARAVERTRTGEAPAAAEKFCFKGTNAKIFVEADRIAGFKAEGNYSVLTTFDGEDLILENLLSLERRLPGEVFKRIDRSTIVNIGKVSRINQQPLSCTLRSDDGRSMELPLSKSGADTLLQLLQGRA